MKCVCSENDENEGFNLMQSMIPANGDVPKRLFSLVLISIGIGVLTIHSAGSGHAGKIATGASTGAPAPRVLKYAMMADLLRNINSKTAVGAIKFHWSHHLKREFIGFEPQFKILADLDSAAQHIRNNRLHGLILDITQYLSLREQVNLKPTFFLSSSTRPLETYVLLVRRDANWQRLSTQSSRRLMTEIMDQPNIGRMWLETVLRERQLPAGDTYFTQITPAAKPERIILPVFFRQADACLVLESAYQTMVELNPQISRQLTVLARSPGFITSIGCATELLSQELIDRFIEKSVNDKSIHSRQLLLIFHVKKIFVFQPEYLSHTENVFRKYKQIIHQSKSYR
jgi:phosphonate transport system substrate-binding protein